MSRKSLTPEAVPRPRGRPQGIPNPNAGRRPSREEDKRRRHTLYLPPDLDDRVTEAVNQEGGSRNGFVLRVLALYFDRVNIF